MRWVYACGLAILLTGASGGQEWVEIVPEGGVPTRRQNTSAIYEPLGHRMVIFAGAGPNGDLDDIWSLDLRQAA